MGQTFTAIDFETATGKRSSICQVGLVRVEDGVVTAELSLLVQPPGNYYWHKLTDIHGITAEDTADAPDFSGIWHRLAPFITGQNVVAHNGFSFDFHCLGQVLDHYSLPTPDYTGHCTYRIYRDNLFSLCKKYNIMLNHHDALSDARACAELFLKVDANGVRVG